MRQLTHLSFLFGILALAACGRDSSADDTIDQLDAPPVAAVGDGVVLRARGSAAGGAGPRVELYVNGVRRGTADVSTATWAAYSFPGAIDSGSVIDVVYVNDAVIDGNDRNLFVDTLSLGNEVLRPTDPGVTYDRGFGRAAFDGADVVASTGSLFWAGALRFTVATSGASSTLRQKLTRWWSFDAAGATLVERTGRSPMTVRGSGVTLADGGVSGKTLRFASTGDGVAYVPRADRSLDKGDTDFFFGGWVAVRDTETSGLGQYLIGRLGGLDWRARGSYGIAWRTIGGAQGFEFIASGNNGVTQVLAHGHGVPRLAGTTMVHVVWQHDAARNRLVGWVDGVRQEASHAAGIRDNDDTNFSIGRGWLRDVDADTVFGTIGFDVDDVFFGEGVITQSEVDYLRTKPSYDDVMAGHPGGNEPPDEEPVPEPAPPAPSANWSALEPFAADSYWKRPIPATARYAGANDPRSQSWQGQRGRLSINYRRWTIWVWEAKPTDPEVTFNVSAGFIGDTANARQGYVTLRMPANAHPDPGDNSSVEVAGWGPCSAVRDSDRHLVVIDVDRKRAHEFWQACRVDGASGEYQATAYVETDLSKDGLNYTGVIRNRATGAPTGEWHNAQVKSYGWGATRAYGGSSLGGSIRAGEVTRGIAHKLSIAVPAAILFHDASDFAAGGVWEPATRPDFAGATGGAHTIKHGQLFAIPKTVDIDAIGLTTPAGRAVAKALQIYGMAVVDQAGVPTLGSDGVAAQADGSAIAAARGDLDIIHRYLVPVDL